MKIELTRNRSDYTHYTYYYYTYFAPPGGMGTLKFHEIS